jgi:hypothetical protein
MTKSKPMHDLLNKSDETIPMSKEDRKWDQIPSVIKEFGSE